VSGFDATAQLHVRMLQRIVTGRVRNVFDLQCNQARLGSFQQELHLHCDRKTENTFPQFQEYVE
jgi:hypothetical protein